MRVRLPARGALGRRGRADDVVVGSIFGWLLGFGFLVLVGICAAEAAQAVGALLVVGLLAAPAGAAHQLTHRPYVTFALSGVLAVGELWTGLALSYAALKLPPGFAILAVAATTYALVLAARRVRALGRPA
jgi:zinc/manganese transport system permease protein